MAEAARRASVVIDNVLKVTGDDGHFDPEAEVAHTEENVARLCRMGCEVVRILSEYDQAGGKE